MNNANIETEVVIVGSGPAGLGCAALLKQMGIEDQELLVIERGKIGQSFLNWPESMRFITPSFPSNGYHQTDLNAITPDTSPAFNSGKEHLSGKEYAEYLQSVANHYQIPVMTETEVESITSLGPNDGFTVETSDHCIRCRFVIWAGGEFQTPNKNAFDGAEHCIHNSEINNWQQLKPGHYYVIGAYESGVDAAYNLSKQGHQVTILDAHDQNNETYDPSQVLSPYSSERMSELNDNQNITYRDNFEVRSVRREQGKFIIQSVNGEEYISEYAPINCTGFAIDLGPLRESFDYQENGYPMVNQFDESTKVRHLFLAGPRLYHEPTLLCFIYKFRGRFASPCRVIAAELELDTKVFKHYQQAGMLLLDLDCCEQQECFC